MLNKGVTNFLEGQLKELNSDNMYSEEYIELYSSFSNSNIRNILSSLHTNLISLFKTMNERLPTKENEAYFWAGPSRQLIKIIDMIFIMKSNLKNTEFSFTIADYYENLLKKCRIFLVHSGGNTLPANMDKIELYYIIPIFELSNTVTTNTINGISTCSLKLIGWGSYANIYKYKDTLYDKCFVVKRAKKELNDKELKRFHREFLEMQKLSSPYIVTVYKYDSQKNQYIMEFMDYTLKAFIEKSNSTLNKSKRKAILKQILRAFIYINSKGILHRDISPTNILIKHYEDVDVVKISDFGLIKIPDSTLTSINTEFKGTFNDPALVTEGFDTYNILHETYALTKIVFYVMTGKTNTSKIDDPKLKEFVSKGLSPDNSKRFSSINELLLAVNKL